MSGNIDTRYLLEVAGDPEIYTRVRLVMELCEFVEDEGTGAAEVERVAPVLLRLADDPSSVVRRTLLTRVCHSRRMPEEVALALAGDEEDIACEVLARCPTFSDDVLHGVARIADAPRLEAIAGRSRLDARTSLALIERGNLALCKTLLKNPGARLDKACYEALEKRHGPLERFERLLMKRIDVPPMLAVRMIEALSDRLIAHARARRWLKPERAVRVAADAKEQGIVRIIARADLAADATVVSDLFAADKITPSLILRAACIGKMDFVEQALCELANMPRRLATSMMSSRGSRGLKALFARAGLPQRIYPALKVALDVHAELSATAGDWDEARFGRRMIERILTQYESFSDADKKYLLAMLKRYAAEETRPLVDQVLEDLRLAA